MIVFADTSALGSLYLSDDADHWWIEHVILGGRDPVVVSELADLELASLLARAEREGRIDPAGLDERLDAYRVQTADDGPIGVASIVGDTLALARRFVLGSPVRVLDAIHLAAARLLADTSRDNVELLTTDSRHADTARALGFALYEPA